MFDIPRLSGVFSLPPNQLGDEGLTELPERMVVDHRQVALAIERARAETSSTLSEEAYESALGHLNAVLMPAIEAYEVAYEAAADELQEAAAREAEEARRREEEAGTLRQQFLDRLKGQEERSRQIARLARAGKAAFSAQAVSGHSAVEALFGAARERAVRELGLAPGALARLEAASRQEVSGPKDLLACGSGLELAARLFLQVAAGTLIGFTAARSTGLTHGFWPLLMVMTGCGFTAVVGLFLIPVIAGLLRRVGLTTVVGGLLAAALLTGVWLQSDYALHALSPYGAAAAGFLAALGISSYVCDTAVMALRLTEESESRRERNEADRFLAAIESKAYEALASDSNLANAWEKAQEYDEAARQLTQDNITVNGAGRALLARKPSLSLDTTRRLVEAYQRVEGAAREIKRILSSGRSPA